jgi:hypothetical protein
LTSALVRQKNTDPEKPKRADREEVADRQFREE